MGEKVARKRGMGMGRRKGEGMRNVSCVTLRCVALRFSLSLSFFLSFGLGAECVCAVLCCAVLWVRILTN